MRSKSEKQRRKKEPHWGLVNYVMKSGLYPKAKGPPKKAQGSSQAEPSVGKVPGEDRQREAQHTGGGLNTLGWQD